MHNISFWGFTASPYQLKMQALAAAAGVPWRRFPEQGSTVQAWGMTWRLRRAQRAQTVQRFPAMERGLDEYPFVPFYTFDDRQFFYDSSGLAYQLEALAPGGKTLLPRLPAQRFICQLIDEAYDEFGLYMVHHNRWVTSAATNCMGDFTGREMRKVLPLGLHRLAARTLPARQVRRCPYLFSVAPAGFDAGVSANITPPARPGFPPTHDILDSAWRRYLASMERILQHQPYLLGDHFTLADASAYGQLSMNLVDGRAADLLQEIAPLTFRWLCMIRDRDHAASHGALSLSEHLGPLLESIAETFIPLMQQNAAAYDAAIKQGQALFNEEAFDRGEALYEGTLLGQPFRAVVKSFQVPVWRDLCRAWSELESGQREQLQALCPLLTDAQFRADAPGPEP